MKSALALFSCLVLLALPAYAQAKGYDGEAPMITDANEAPAGLQPMDAPQPEEQSDGPQVMAPTIHRVTSLQKCLDQLDPVEAAEVKLNTVHPYQECMARVSERAAERRHLKVSKRGKKSAETEAEEPETPRNFRRVGKDDSSAEPEMARPSKNVNGYPTLEGNYWASTLKAQRAAETAGSKPPRSPEALARQSYEGEEDNFKSYKTRSFFGWKPAIKSDNSTPSYNR